MARTTVWGVALGAVALAQGILAADVLTTSGFTNCESDASIDVKTVDITYDKTASSVTFDVMGTSNKEQKVMATLNVTAYGFSVYSSTFNPCDNSTYVAQMCPGELLMLSDLDIRRCFRSNNVQFLLAPSQQVGPKISQKNTPVKFLR